MDNRVRVLLVDDEDRFCETTSKLLIKKGFDTAIANNAEKALDMLKDQKKDVIVLDIKMAGMDGHTALHEIKKTDPDIQVIILTGHGSRYSAMRALVTEAFDYLAKPCDIEVLASRIHDAFLAKHHGFKLDDKKALDIMTPIHKLTVIPADMTVKQAVEKNADLVLVFDRRRILMGVLTRKDIIRAVRPEYVTGNGPVQEDSARFSSIFWSGYYSDRIMTVSRKTVMDILPGLPPVISENANLLEVAYLMSGSSGGVLLVKDISKIIGVITEKDIFAEIATAMEEQ